MLRNPTTRSPASDLVVIAGAAGGLGAVRTILGGLPEDFSAAVVVLLHDAVWHDGLSGGSNADVSPLPLERAEEGDILLPGTIYVVPPDMHMNVTAARTVALVGGGTINHVASSADPLFASAALSYGERVIAVVLSGEGSDGAAGVRSVLRESGTVLVQAPDSAQCGEMPRAAIAAGPVDMVASVEEIVPVLARLSFAGLHDVEEVSVAR